MDHDATVDELLRIGKAIGYGQIPPYQSNETFTSGAFDLIIFNGSDPARNFDLLSALCGRYDQVKVDARFRKGFFYLLNQLSYATRTTELPTGLTEILDDQPEETKELQVWYRETKC
jgi:hypothetical protein